MRRLLATAALAVAIAACGGGSDGTAETPVAAEAPVTTVAPPATPAPDPPDDEAAPTVDEPVATTAAPASTTTTVPVEVPEKLQHVGEAVGGGELDLSVYAGRDTIAWFWAPW